jgi:periplasmic divalent cation tolerance protein
MSKADIIVVLTHAPDQICAERIAKAIIKSKLAACVNIGSACQSVYEWENKLEVQTEIPIQIKTCQRCYTELEALISEMHPYELPDIITLNVDGGLSKYLQWVNDKTLQ